MVVEKTYIGCWRVCDFCLLSSSTVSNELIPSNMTFVIYGASTCKTLTFQRCKEHMLSWVGASLGYLINSFPGA